jgi:3' terminal RNA ribose 2'-O-methyltransferase Hen1
VLITITTTHRPATDLGYLLHKNPTNVRTVKVAFGTAHVFFPEASEERCTAALLLEVDPIGLTRRGRGRSNFPLADYVNDRPYVASSFMSSAIARLFGTAMSGRSDDRPELAATPIPLSVRMPAVPARGGEEIVRTIFEPLGYAVTTVPIALDERFPAWGDSRYLDVTLDTEALLKDVLAHLYVLLPVLDDEKHYWVDRDEIDKLLKRGETWLAEHPDRELIVRRFLRQRPQLAREALAQLLEEDQGDPDAEEVAHDREEDAVEERISLADQRMGTVIAALKAAGARRVVDLGCGEGRLLRSLLADRDFTSILGVDVSMRALQAASRKLRLDRLPPMQRERIDLVQSSVTYRDRRLEGYDAICLVEVIEHLDPPRLSAFESTVFGEARPPTVVVTTPNVEYNPRFETLPEGTLRHRDHRFEWTRAEFATWAGGVAERHGYAVRSLPVGPDDPEVGPPTQMAVFSR